MITATITGLAELAAAFTNAPKMTRAAISARAKDLAEEVADAIREAAPVDEGALRESVRVEPNERGAVVRAGGPLTTKEVRQGSGVGYDYSLAIEFGTSTAAARPFFYPTVRRFEKQIERSLGEAVENAIGDL